MSKGKKGHGKGLHGGLRKTSFQKKRDNIKSFNGASGKRGKVAKDRKSKAAFFELRSTLQVGLGSEKGTALKGTPSLGDLEVTGIAPLTKWGLFMLTP